MAPIDEIEAKFRAAMAGAIADAKDELTAIAEAGGEAAAGGLLGDVGRIADILGNLEGLLGAIVDVVFPPLGVLDAAEKAGGKLGVGFGSGYLLGYALFTLLQPYILIAQHEVASQAQSEIFDPDTAARLVARGIIPQAFGASEAAGGNFDGTHFNQLVDDATSRPGPPELFEMYRRGLLQQGDLATALERLGYSGFWLDKWQGIIRQLLSPADLALAVLRQDMPQAEAEQYAATLGYLQPDFDTLLLNTGEPPGPEQLMEALRRGIIGPERFAKGIAESRLRPEWLDVLTELRYSPMSVADTVRAVVENYLTPEQGAGIAQENGLKPEHWQYLVESWGRPLAHEQMRQLVNRGVASRAQFDQAIRESDVKDTYLDLSWEVGRRLIPERLIVTALSHGSINDTEAHDRLAWLGYDPADADLLIATGTAEGRTTKHQLSRTDIAALYEDGKLPRPDALKRLTDLGFTSADANDVLDLADLKARATALRTQERSIEASYKAHHLTDIQAKDQLISLGVDPQQAQSMVDEWTNVRGRATKSLTEAQIVKLAEDGVITADDATNRLIAYGLSPGDANLLLADKGVVPPPPGSPLAAQLGKSTPPAGG